MNSLYFFFAVLLVHQGRATSLDQLNQDFINIFKECVAKNPVSVADLETLAKKTMPDNEASKCLFACAYQKTGMMDADNKLSAAGVKKSTQKYFPNNAEKMKISDDFIQACIGVNNETLSGGSEECERAALIFKCTMENAPKFKLV